MASNWWSALWREIGESIRMQRTQRRQAHVWLQRYRDKHGKASDADQSNSD
ncbi:MAG: hypothetical protein VKL39_16115 [Leptolyngbyaceae bacterium]|nr:hypothetical protein [Leptolyngbyaceae bacterium]